ncbi:hypothetical protein [uncultured Erythrobacter sp.]|uniref:hypothetical protein n=1 Tax=uncultured Erythrobacter sp. TaxID=263913 RepID=UPI0026024BD2|nr:hypothetical protein [uncultured Erythrobacter sp.]
MIKRIARLATHLLTLVALMWSGAALADVQIHFHSFNGSVLFGRYPHTFIVLEGTLDDGTAVNENYGFTAQSSSAAITRDWVGHLVESEPQRYVRRTNRHFSITLTDTQYRRIVQEVRLWKDEPGSRYSLDQRNCIHFVGRMAQLVGLRVEYPDNMLRRPKKWLNHITSLNPQLGAELID